jgi:hypothetical protein
MQEIKLICTYTGAEQYVQTPTHFFDPMGPGSGVCCVNVTALGARGGDAICAGPLDPNGNFCTYGGGAAGATVSAPLVGLAETTFYQARVGGSGPNGDPQYAATPGGYNGGGSTAPDWNSQTQNGGGGGGATDLRAAPYGLSDRLVVAGGGGGAGGGGDGGGPDPELGWGGAGGLNGVKGSTGIGLGASSPPDGGGLGGTQTEGGAGGLLDTEYDPSSGTEPGGDGSLGQGGSGPLRGGGGGGGFYGGGSGNGPDGGGGAGGSSYGPDASTFTTGSNDGPGLLIVRYLADAPTPTCQDGAADTDYQSPVDIALACNEPTGQLLLQGFSIVSQPANGTATIPDPTVGSASYTPDAGFVGTDTFTYDNTSANGQGAPATVTVTTAECTITGTSESDDLVGTSGDDVICGLAGSDALSGQAGNDRLYGDAGGDVLNGGPGKDTITETGAAATAPRTAAGARGNTVRAGKANDRVKAANGIRDRIDCGHGTRDRATVDRFDRVKRCEKVKPKR